MFGELNLKFHFIYLYIFSTLLDLFWCFEENCDYLDTTKETNTNYLSCHGNGCCGDFKNRHCCYGPIVALVAVFGSIIGVLVIVVVVGYCYTRYNRKGQGKSFVSPEIQVTSTGYYDDVPLPSPLTSAPPVYSPHKLHPPLHTNLAPFRELSNIDRNPPPVFSGRRS